MRYGHSPAAIDDYAWRDVVAFLDVVAHLDPMIGGMFDGR